MRKNKYNAKRVIDPDYGVFDSKMEYARFKELKFQEKTGEIWSLERQPAYPITIKGKHICNVELDYQYKTKVFGEGHVKVIKVIEDVKGCDNTLSRLKRRLVEAQYGIRVHLTRPRK